VGLILGSSLGGTLTQLTSFRTMIGTNAVLIFGGAIYLAVVALQHVKRVRQQGV
jgi:flagellar motor component MotA